MLFRGAVAVAGRWHCLCFCGGEGAGVARKHPARLRRLSGFGLATSAKGHERSDVDLVLASARATLVASSSGGWSPSESLPSESIESSYGSRLLRRPSGGTTHALVCMPSPRPTGAVLRGGWRPCLAVSTRHVVICGHVRSQGERGTTGEISAELPNRDGPRAPAQDRASIARGSGWRWRTGVMVTIDRRANLLNALRK